MHAIRRIALVVVLFVTFASSASGAGTSPVARADFNADTVGESPDPSLPGLPDGDSLSLLGSNWIAVVDSSGPLTDQPVEMNRTSGGVGSPKMFLEWEPSNCATWTMRWCSVARTVIPPIFFVLRADIVRGPEEAGRGTYIFASMGTRGSNIFINTTSGETTVGSWTMGDADCFEWTVDLAAQTTSLEIDGVMVAENLEIPGSLLYDVSIFGIEASSTIAFTYALDDFEILAGDCPTPVEPTSWGRLKARYR